jgi:hypothetical protein
VFQEIDPWDDWVFLLEGFSALKTGGVSLEHKLDLVADTSEFVEDFLLGSRSVRRVVKAPVEAVKLSGEHGAGLIGITTDGDHGINRTVQELIHVLGMMSRDVDADFVEDFDGLGVDIACRLGTGTGYFDEITSCGTEDAFCQVAAAGIAGTEDEDERFHTKSRVGSVSAGTAKPCITRVGNEIDAAEELGETGAGNLVKNLDPPFFTDKKPSIFHDGKMFGKRGDIASSHHGEFGHAMFPMHEGFHDKQSRGVGHRLDNGGTGRCFGFELMDFWHHLFGKYAK